MNEPFHIRELVFKYNQHELGPEDEIELLAWRRLSPENELYFQEEISPARREAVRQAAAAVKESNYRRIVAEYPLQPDEAPVIRLPRKWVFRIAGCLLGAVVLYKILTFDLDRLTGGSKPAVMEARFTNAQGIEQSLEDIKNGFNDGRAARQRDKARRKMPFLAAPYDTSAATRGFNTMVTYEHGRYLMQLPDESYCWQNVNSSVAYPVNFFRDTPKLRVTGEVFIELPRKSDLPPFEVSTGKISITAFATVRFSVRAYPKDSAVTITAVEGQIQVKSDSSVIMLQPKEQLTLSHGKAILHKDVDIEKVLAWKTN
ncbi:MAG TPA: FecR domain-containing protein [Puia sp.]|nr:FecR domain-containing protein [Puia sp.]